MIGKMVIIIVCLYIILIGIILTKKEKKSNNDPILSYIVDPKTQKLSLFWKNDQGKIFKSIQNLKEDVESKNQTLSFAMNGGMYQQDNSPLGLYIENQKVITPLNTKKGYGNFYIRPNGIFYITTDHSPNICTTPEFNQNENIKYATQSGPMLVIEGQIHSAFKKGSRNLEIRNGVGILPNKKVLFAMSKKEINFYDFAEFFQKQGCKNALFLDGVISKTYLPEQDWTQTEGEFGVIIGVTPR
jgi:uncharacterized protein YigE (DUF2233 family)